MQKRLLFTGWSQFSALKVSQLTRRMYAHWWQFSVAFSKSEISFDIDTPTWKSYLAPTRSLTHPKFKRSKALLQIPVCPRGVIGGSSSPLPVLSHFHMQFRIKLHQPLWMHMYLWMHCIYFKPSFLSSKFSDSDKEKYFVCGNCIWVSFHFVIIFSNLNSNGNIVHVVFIRNVRCFHCHAVWNILVASHTLSIQLAYPHLSSFLLHQWYYTHMYKHMHCLESHGRGQAYKWTEGFGGLKSLQILMVQEKEGTAQIRIRYNSYFTFEFWLLPHCSCRSLWCGYEYLLCNDQW